MKKKQHTHTEIFKERKEKNKYISPTLDVMIVEMECGIAANSASTSPSTVNGNTDLVSTDWQGNDDIIMDSYFLK